MLRTPPRDPLRARGRLHLVASALGFGLMAAFVKLAGRSLPTSEIVMARACISLLLSWLLLRRRRVSPWGHARSLLLLRGVFGFGGLCCFYYAVTHLPLAEATVIHFTNPILTAALAALVLGERSGLGVIVGLMCGLGGTLLVARPSVGGEHALAPLAVAIAFGGALFSAAAYVTVRRLARSEDPLVIVFYFPLVAVPAALPWVMHDFVWPRGIEWLWLALVGVFTQVGQVQLTRGLKLLPAGQAMTIGYLQIVFAAALGLLLFGETPAINTWLGCGLIVAGAFAAR
ncbi:MAG: DMT family transporter [Planctomycetota bacterium]